MRSDLSVWWWMPRNSNLSLTRLTLCICEVVGRICLRKYCLLLCFSALPERWEDTWHVFDLFMTTLCWIIPGLTLFRRLVRLLAMIIPSFCNFWLSTSNLAIRLTNYRSIDPIKYSMTNIYPMSRFWLWRFVGAPKVREGMPSSSTSLWPMPLRNYPTLLPNPTSIHSRLRSNFKKKVREGLFRGSSKFECQLRLRSWNCFSTAFEGGDIRVISRKRENSWLEKVYPHSKRTTAYSVMTVEPLMSGYPSGESQSCTTLS